MSVPFTKIEPHTSIADPAIWRELIQAALERTSSCYFVFAVDEYYGSIQDEVDRIYRQYNRQVDLMLKNISDINQNLNTELFQGEITYVQPVAGDIISPAKIIAAQECLSLLAWTTAVAETSSEPDTIGLPRFAGYLCDWFPRKLQILREDGGVLWDSGWTNSRLKDLIPLFYDLLQPPTQAYVFRCEYDWTHSGVVT